VSPTLANTRTQPVELHLAAGVVVVPPMGRVDCDEDDLALGQVQELARRGVLAVLPAAPSAAVTRSGVDAEAEEPPAGKPSRTRRPGGGSGTARERDDGTDPKDQGTTRQQKS
jgi:hypothetical protein